jgi:hypothetical protein
LLRVKEKEVAVVEHAGSLAGSRSLLLIDRAANRFLVLHWSLVTPLRKKDNADGPMLLKTAHRTLFNHGN